MRPHCVVVTTPAFDDDLRLAQCVEDLAIEQFVAQPGVKALDKPVLPRTAWRDVGGLCSDSADPLLHRLGNKLRAIIGTDMPGNAAQDKQVGEHIDDIDRLEPARYPNGQTLVGKFGMMLSMRNLRPSWVRSSTKSYDQTWLGRSARSRMHDPSFSHSRPRLGCLAGTFSPSRRQIRSTRLSLTSQPARRSSSAILR